MGKLKTVGGPQYDEKLRLWLKEHIEQYPHLTTAILSKSDHIGITRTALDAYLSGAYFLPKESGGYGANSAPKIERLIRAYREKVEGTERHGYANSFMETRTWKQILAAWATAVAENVIVVCYGRPRLGKSRAAIELGVRNMTTMPIVITASMNITVRYFIQRIAQEIGIDDGQPIARLEDLVIKKLKTNPRPLIVDQANYLPEKSLGTVCYVWDGARIPIMLLGTKLLYDRFTTSRMTQDVRSQIMGRVSMHYPLEDLSLGECKAIVKRALGTDATDEMIAQIYRVTGGVYGHVEMLIPRVQDLKQMKHNQEGLRSGAVTMQQIIDTAGRRLMVA